MLQHPTRDPDAVGLDHFKQQEDQGHHDSKHALKVLPIDAGKDEKRHDGSRTKVSNLKSLSDEDAAGMNNGSLSSASETEQNSYNGDAHHSAEHDKNPANPTRFSPPTLATNLPSLCCDDKDTTKFPSWVQLMKWLPSTEDLQTGFLFDAPPVTRSNNLSQGKDNNKNRGDDGAELVVKNSGLLVEGQVACQEAEEDPAQAEPATTTTPNSHTTHAQPSTLAGCATALRATSTRGRVQLAQPAANLDYDSAPSSSDSSSGLEDEESLQKLEVVKGLREWVLMQPVHLGRPVSSDNPTFYSLYLRWANLQNAMDGPEESDKDFLGRTSSLEGDAIVVPSSPSNGGETVSLRGRPRKTPAHLRSFELYEESWLQGKKTKKRVVPDKPKPMEPSLSDVAPPAVSSSGLISTSPKRKLPDLVEKPSPAVEEPAKRRKSNNKESLLPEVPSQEADDSDNTTTPKPGTKGRKPRGRPKSLQDDTIEANGKRKRKKDADGEIKEEMAELDDPTFVPSTSPTKELASPRRGGGENGKKTPKKKGKKADTLKHLRPATVESCHRCKNRKEYWMGCPIVEAHRYCKGCVERHFSLDYEANSPKSAEIWAGGCPICKLTCLCAACRRRKEALEAGLNPPAKRRRFDGEEDYQGDKGSSLRDEGEKENGKPRRTRSQTKNDVAPDEAESPTASEKVSGVVERKPRRSSTERKKELPSIAVTLPRLNDSTSDLDGGEDDYSGEEKHSSPGRHGGKTTRMQTRSRTKGKPKGDKNETPSLQEEEEEDDVSSLADLLYSPSRVGTVRQENGYYVLEDSDNVEALVGLTGAGSVLSRRYSAPANLPRLPPIKTLGGGW